LLAKCCFLFKKIQHIFNQAVGSGASPLALVLQNIKTKQHEEVCSNQLLTDRACIKM